MSGLSQTNRDEKVEILGASVYQEEVRMAGLLVRALIPKIL